ncbi:protein TEX261-like [Rhopilema esculentum]|uniref:protein TEX261-like n=1 Tax=Rhopilema esculentum TaxID=499914 RepID=UPI0031DA9434
MFLYILTWISTVIHIVFLTLSLAAGLYYLAELVEEYTVTTAKVIKYILIGSTVAVLGVFFLEQMPLHLTGLVLLSHFLYATLLSNFPYISLSSLSFIFSCVLLVVNHYLAFSYFAEVLYSFQEILAYFTICLWIVPFSFFVSLSVNEYVLPTMQTTDISGSSSVIGPNTGMLISKKSKRGGLLAVFDYFNQKKDDLLLRNKRF